MGPLDVLVGSVPGGDGLEEEWGILKLSILKEKKEEETQEIEKVLVGVDLEARVLSQEIVELEDILKLDNVGKEGYEKLK